MINLKFSTMSISQKQAYKLFLESSDFSFRITTAYKEAREALLNCRVYSYKTQEEYTSSMARKQMEYDFIKQLYDFQLKLQGDLL